MSTVEMRKLIVDLEILLEFKLIDGYLYQNPNEKQTENLLKKFNELRGIFYDENVYVWNSYEKIHGAVMHDTFGVGDGPGDEGTYDRVSISFMINQFGNNSEDDEYKLSYWKDKFFIGIVGRVGGFNAEARKQFQKLLSQPLVKRAFGPEQRDEEDEDEMPDWEKLGFTSAAERWRAWRAEQALDPQFTQDLDKVDEDEEVEEALNRIVKLAGHSILG